MTRRTCVGRIMFGAVSALALTTSLGLAGQARAAESAAPRDEPEVEQVVVTATAAPVTAVAPVRANLEETEPEAIITRKFIEEAAPRVGDFTTIAAMAPSVVTKPNPSGAGLADGGKISLRGFADGQFNVTYDDIPWSDANGPSHHAAAYFPSSTIGGMIIERGPGDATELGQANFGGQVNLLSLPFEQTRSLEVVGTAASYNTYQGVLTLQSGTLEQFHDAHLVANFQALGSDGYLTYNRSWSNNEMIKGDIKVTDKLTLSGLYLHTTGFYNKSDIGDASVAQTEQFGSNFSLGNDPTLENYYGYNWVHKDINFAYIRLAGDLGNGFGINQTIYDYDYNNSTESGANNLATASADVVTLTPGTTYPAPGKSYPTSLQTYGVPAYYKKNQYVTRGDITKFTKDFGFGTLTVGGMYEQARTYRFIDDIDALTGLPDYREKAATMPGPSGVYTPVPLSTQYDEHSGWNQYQLFSQFEWKPTEQLTITPGVKYVHFDLFVNAGVEKLPAGSQPLNTDQLYTKTLPFLTANYRLTPNWSAYAQYAQGMLAPNIGNLYVANPSAKILPQLSTNYQLGTVYNKGPLSLDADIYYIDFKNKIQTFTDITTGQSYSTNSGGAYYRGIELNGTWAITHDVAVYANWSRNQAIGDNDASNPLYNGHQLTGVAGWTAALGFRYAHEQIFTSDDDVIVALFDKWEGPQYVTNASCSSAPNGICAPGATLTPVTGLIKTTSEADLSVTYRIGRYSVEGQVLNLFDTHDLLVAKGKALIPGTNLWAQSSADGGGANTFEYQVPRNFSITLKAKF